MVTVLRRFGILGYAEEYPNLAAYVGAQAPIDFAWEYDRSSWHFTAVARRTLPDCIALLRNAKVSIADNEC
jgi:hypothetical protein